MNYGEEHFYSEVAELATDLSREERETLMGYLRDALVTYEEAALGNLKFRSAIYAVFNARRQTQLNTGRGGASSKLSRKRNSAVTGLNQQLGTMVEADLRNANTRDFNKEDGATEILLGTQFNYEKLLMTEYLVDVLRKNNVTEALDALAEARGHQTKLHLSVLKMAAAAARERKNGAPGDTIEYGDFLHEAYMVTVEATRLFDPTRYPTDCEAAAVFTKYIYRTLRGGLSHYEVENSRIVKVPRTRVDRWRAVGEAQSRMPTSSYFELAKLATIILCERREASTGRRKIPQSEAYTEAEVFELVQLTQSSISLHEPESLKDGESDYSVEVGDLIINEDPLPDQQVDLNSTHDSLVTLLKDNCWDNDQYLSLMIRYGLRDDSDWVSLSRASRMFEEQTGRKLSKSRLAEYERDFQARVRKNPTQAKEILEVFNGR
jgi:hypothetical protein